MDVGYLKAWIVAQQDRTVCDPIVVLVDDFIGTGGTLVDGLRKLQDGFPREFDVLVDEGRLMCSVMIGFSEGIETIQDEFPGVHVLAGRQLGDDLRAFHPNGRIFSSTPERELARERMANVGADIMPTWPLGFGWMEALVAVGRRCPNNSLPIFWSNGTPVRPWMPLFSRPNSR